jgi:hypothetical protein
MVKSGYLHRPTMPLSALRYADGLFGEDHHPLKLFIPLELLQREVSPPSEEDVPLIEHQRVNSASGVPRALWGIALH